jgi:hypothetical protein
MEIFEQTLLDIKKKIPELKSQCICPDCPSFNECARDEKEILYCIYGRSFTCVTEDLGCICPGCPLITDLGLVNLTFCLHGSKQAQRNTKTIEKVKSSAIPL